MKMMKKNCDDISRFHPIPGLYGRTDRIAISISRDKNWPDIGISLALGLQRGINSISLQCIPWPVACSEWCTCLTTSKFGGLGVNDPWMETFHKFLSEVCVLPTIHVSWPNLAKIGRCEVAEKSSGVGVAYKKDTRPGHFLVPISPPLSHLTDRAQNFVNVVGHWPVHVYRLRSRSAAVCRTYSGKSQKKSIGGFQRTNMVDACFSKPEVITLQP